MRIYTNNKSFAHDYLHDNIQFSEGLISNSDSLIKPVLEKLVGDDSIYFAESKEYDAWKHIILTDFSAESQFDSLIELSRNQILPDKIICQAGYGKKFHGFRNRSWESLPGNLHITAYFSPMQEISNFGAGFLILAAVSVFQTIDAFPELKGLAAIKWVNDIVIGSAKVCGVLAQTQVTGREITGAVVGIGLNVEKTPAIEPTPFVTHSACLNDYSTIFISQREVFEKLVYFLSKNYEKLISGKYFELLEIYRNNSCILGKNVAIWSDDLSGNNVIEYKGKIKKIGDNLELYLEGISTPITKGRLSLQD